MDSIRVVSECITKSQIIFFPALDLENIYQIQNRQFLSFFPAYTKKQKKRESI
jgi:hypothetical protein